MNPDDVSLTPRSTPLPIDTYWVCAGSHFEVTALLGQWRTDGIKAANQVTLLIMTPPAPGSDRTAPYESDEAIWVTRHNDVDPAMRNVKSTHSGVETVRPRK